MSALNREGFVRHCPGMSQQSSSGPPSLGAAVRQTNLQCFRGGLVFKAHRLVYYSTLGFRVRTEKTSERAEAPGDAAWRQVSSPGSAWCSRASPTCARSPRQLISPSWTRTRLSPKPSHPETPKSSYPETPRPPKTQTEGSYEVDHARCQRNAIGWFFEEDLVTARRAWDLTS